MAWSRALQHVRYIFYIAEDRNVNVVLYDDCDSRNSAESLCFIGLREDHRVAVQRYLGSLQQRISAGYHQLIPGNQDGNMTTKKGGDCLNPGTDY